MYESLYVSSLHQQNALISAYLRLVFTTNLQKIELAITLFFPKTHPNVTFFIIGMRALVVHGRTKY